MGKNIFNCGAPGAGGIAKICNNLMFGIHLIGVSEGMLIGERLGMDPKTMVEVFDTCTSKCWSLNVNTPRPGIKENAASNNYDGGFGVSLIKKDLNLALDVA